MPSNNVAVTLALRYWRAGAPCGGACAGIAVGPGSGCCDAARDELSAAIFACTGVPVRGGTGLWALGAFPNTGAGDYDKISKYTTNVTLMPCKPQRTRQPL